MSKDLKDILSNLDPAIDQETLLRYLQGKLSEAEQHQVEKGMLADDFDADALDGLQEFADKKKLTLLVDQLRSDLRRRTEKKKRLRQKLALRLEPWLVISLIIILILAFISFLVVYHKLKH